MADYFESGFTVRTASWHGKETVLEQHPENWDAAREAAGLMWEPRLTPLYRKNEAGEFVEAEGAKLVERDDTSAPLGVVSDRFELISHASMGSIMESVLGQPNVKFDTAGSVRDGKMVYATVLLDEPYTIKGDIDGFGDEVLTVPYMAIVNSHDGTGACKVVYTDVRVVCANTVQAASADGDRHGAQFILRHTTGATQRIEEARQAIDLSRAESLRWRKMAEELALQVITPNQTLTFLDEFIPSPVVGIISDRVRNNIAAERAKFMHLLNNSATNGAMADNALGLVNAAIEYLDHARGFNNRATYMGRQILRAEPLKAKAVKLVRELVNA